MRGLWAPIALTLPLSGCWAVWELAGGGQGGGAGGSATAAVSTGPTAGSGGSPSSSTAASSSSGSGGSSASSSSSTSSSAASTSSGVLDAGCDDTFGGTTTGAVQVQFPHELFFPYAPTHSLVAAQVAGLSCSPGAPCGLSVFPDVGGVPNTAAGAILGGGTVGANGKVYFSQPISFAAGETYWFSIGTSAPAPAAVGIQTTTGQPVSTYTVTATPITGAPQQKGPFLFSVLCQ